MDYEEKLKAIINSDKTPFVDIDTFLKYFPELKESEDEKIWIINYLSNRILNSTIIAEKENLKKAIAWLENQGEKDMKEALRTEYEKGRADAIAEMQKEQAQEYLEGVDRVQNYEELTKFEKGFDRIADTYAHRKNKDGYNKPWYTKERAAEMLYWAKEELGIEQKSAWSEEDENRLSSVLFLLHEYKNYNFDRWLKSLKDRVQPQNITYYNPYKEVVESIAEMCKHYDTASHSGLRDFYDNVRVKCKDAKEYDSLYPQTAWKPSDEQVECLSDAIKHYNSQGYTAPVLKELLEQLKKIREE